MALFPFPFHLNLNYYFPGQIPLQFFCLGVLWKQGLIGFGVSAESCNEAHSPKQFSRNSQYIVIAM